MPPTPPQFIESRDFARVARAIAFVDGHFREQPRLGSIADAAGLSPFHFERLFRRWAGITPKQYLAAVTGEAARSALASERSVLAAAHEVGLSGAGRLHDLTVTLEGLTPGEMRSGGAGTTIRAGFTSTPFGAALIGQAPRGLCHLAFVDEGGEGPALANLRSRWPGADVQRDDALAAHTARCIWPGSPGGDALRLLVRGTNFQLRVWRALLELGSDRRITYTDLARAIGSPSSVRAVGNAVGANPVAWLIPCHNVLRTSGALGGYRWGEARKRAMLAWTSTRVTGGAAGSGGATRPAVAGSASGANHR